MGKESNAQMELSSYFFEKDFQKHKEPTVNGRLCHISIPKL